MTSKKKRRRAHSEEEKMNPITQEILKNAFTTIPDEMDAALKRTALHTHQT